MYVSRVSNINVEQQQVLLAPAEIQLRLPRSSEAEKTVLLGRDVIRRILDRQDHRLFVVVGPCSIHDLKAAHDYARRLHALAAEVEDTLFLVMRVYFEKPRTTIGWKGLINDPDLDDSFNIEKGLQIARGLLLELAEMGLPTGTEALDPITPQYISDLIAWTAVGARTTESQTHREMASGLSTPIGFKNGTDGNLKVAINAMQSSAKPHSFLGINRNGQCSVVRTRGNRYSHMVLRGGSKPNYDATAIRLCEQELLAADLPLNIVVDCSHANCNKDPKLQPLVLKDCVQQIADGNRSLVGFMIESNLEAGNQPIPADLSQLKYGVSVTDPCVDWATTAQMLREARARLKEVLPQRLAMAG